LQLIQKVNKKVNQNLINEKDGFYWGYTDEIKTAARMIPAADNLI